MTFKGSCLHPCNGNDKSALKRYEDNQEVIQLPDKSIESFNKIPYVFNLIQLRSLTLSHNKIKSLPPEIDRLENLENLNLFNNYISELPNSICNLSKLRCLNIGMNNIHSLPDGIHQLVQLEVLDLSYNFLTEHSFPPEFFFLENLKALYLCDNELENVPQGIGNLKNLIILGLRDNHLVTLPEEILQLQRLRELLIQNNRIRMLPPELAGLDFNSPRSVIRMDGNPFDMDLVDQLKLGISHVLDYIRSDIYQSRYSRYLLDSGAPPPKNEERYQRKLFRLKGK